MESNNGSMIYIMSKYCLNSALVSKNKKKKMKMHGLAVISKKGTKYI